MWGYGEAEGVDGGKRCVVIPVCLSLSWSERLKELVLAESGVRRNSVLRPLPPRSHPALLAVRYPGH